MMSLPLNSISVSILSSPKYLRVLFKKCVTSYGGDLRDLVPKESQAPSRSPCSNGHCPQDVDAHLSPWLDRVSHPKDASFVGKDVHCDDADDASCTVNSRGIQRVIPTQPEHAKVAQHEGQATKDAHNDRGPGRVHVAPAALGHHARKGAIQGHEIAPLFLQDPAVEEENGETASTAAQDGVDDDPGHGVRVSGPGNGQLRAAVEGQKAKDENESTQSSKRHRVAWHVHRLAIGIKSALSVISVIIGNSIKCFILLTVDP